MITRMLRLTHRMTMIITHLAALLRKYFIAQYLTTQIKIITTVIQVSHHVHLLTIIYSEDVRSDHDCVSDNVVLVYSCLPESADTSLVGVSGRS